MDIAFSGEFNAIARIAGARGDPYAAQIDVRMFAPPGRAIYSGGSRRHKPRGLIRRAASRYRHATQVA
jgi:hypothetical protein